MRNLCPGRGFKLFPDGWNVVACGAIHREGSTFVIKMFAAVTTEAALGVFVAA
jgi:hypothetical protein